MHHSLNSGQPSDNVDLPRLAGGTPTPGRPGFAGWQLINVHRGLHFPIRKGYLTEPDGKLAELAQPGTEVVVISCDPETRAAQMVEGKGRTAPMGHDLTVAQVRGPGPDVSTPGPEKETDQPLPGPGLFLIDPDGDPHMVDTSNAPFLRPDLGKLPARIVHVVQIADPIHGTRAG